MLHILLGCLFLVSIGLVGCVDATNQKNLEPKAVPAQAATDNRVVGQYIVTMKEGRDSETLTEVFQQYGIKSIKDLSQGRYVITLEQDPGPEEISKQAASSSEIDHVQPNYIYRTMEPVQERHIQ